MAEELITDETEHGEIARIIRTNHQIREKIHEQIQVFLTLKNDLMENLLIEQIDENPIIQNNAKFFDSTQIEFLNEQITSPKIQLALVGTNSCGKTSLLHFLLRSGNFLPVDVGAVTARIVRLTYAEADHAILYVYNSFNDRQIHREVRLEEYFLRSSEPDWNGIKHAIEEHVMRPKDLPTDSDVFAQWATYFIEIRIPSSFLRLGIDIYDTPGLLFSDAPVLKNNLCQLVKSVKPTLVFMYEHVAINSDTRDCFLAIKQAIGPLSDVSLFFLNTKADIDRIVADANPYDLDISDEKLSELIFEERQTRYNYLLNISSIINEFPQGWPASFEHCSCFDIINVHSEGDSFGAQLNNQTLHRLIQFTANADLQIARKMSDLVLPMIDAFFDLVFTSRHRTLPLFRNLLAEALQWTDYFYKHYRKLMQDFLNEFYENILRHLEENVDQFAQRAGRYQSKTLVDEYIKSTFQQDVIKYQIRQMRVKYTNRKLLEQLTDANLVKIAQKNEFLIAAQRQSNWLCRLDQHSIDKKSTRQIFAEQTILAQILLISDILIGSTDQDSNSKTSTLANYREAFKRKPSSGREFIPMEHAKERLNDVGLWFINLRSYINEILDAGYEGEKQGFIEKIYQFYHLAERSIGQREKLYRLIGRYSEQCATIECRILCILNSNKKFFNIDSLRVVSGDLYIHPQGYLIKKTSDYLEVHHHLRMIQLNIPNIFPLMNVFQQNEFTAPIWLIFPNNYRRLREIQLTIDNLFEICIDLADTLAHLHFYEITHGNLRIESLFLDENNQCYLANFHFDRNDRSLVADDILSLVNLGKYLYQWTTNTVRNISPTDLRNLQQLDELFDQCLLSDTRSRMTAGELMKKIKDIRK